ncbi:hypothetical protein E4T42_01002 [Aureobasidium subglaciale]|nr:hypothetical protein E4T42_01002 [Aureobasidium subglaciale]
MQRPVTAAEFDWDLDVEDTATVKLMVHYLYHHDYHEDVVCLSNNSSRHAHLTKGILADHARMYAMGEKYGIPRLKTLALAKYKECFDTTNSGLCTALVIAFSGIAEPDHNFQEMVTHDLWSWSCMFKNNSIIQDVIRSTPELSYGLYAKYLEDVTGDGGDWW